MAKPRFLISLSEHDRENVDKVLERLKIKSVGQLLEMLVSGNDKQIDVISEGFKRVHDLF